MTPATRFDAFRWRGGSFGCRNRPGVSRLTGTRLRRQEPGYAVARRSPCRRVLINLFLSSGILFFTSGRQQRIMKAHAGKTSEVEVGRVHFGIQALGYGSELCIGRQVAGGAC